MNKALLNGVCAYNLLMLGPLTMKLGTVMYVLLGGKNYDIQSEAIKI